MIASGWGYDIWSLLLGFGAGLACGFLNTAASAGSAVSLPILMMIGLDPVSANATNRIPVLIGALSATARFHQRKALPWEVALKVSLPVMMGGLIGAGLAEVLPGRDLALIITAAVLVALVLLFTKLKQAIESATSEPARYGVREFLLFTGIGVWLGFIVLDGATYLLLALTLAVGLHPGERRQKRGAGSHDHRCDACFRLQGQHRLGARGHHGCGQYRGRCSRSAMGNVTAGAEMGVLVVGAGDLRRACASNDPLRFQDSLATNNWERALQKTVHGPRWQEAASWRANTESLACDYFKSRKRA